MIDHADSNLDSLRYQYERLAEWVSPTTPFEFEVALPIDDCAERLRRSRPTGFTAWLLSPMNETEVQATGDGNYQFISKQTHGKLNLQAAGLLTDNGDGETRVEGTIQHSTDARAILVFFAISVVMIFGFGMVAFRSLPFLGILICFPFAVIISAAGLAWNRSLLLASHREGIGRIMTTLIINEQPAKKKKRLN